MDPISILLTAAQLPYPQYAILGVVVVFVLYLFWQVKAMRALFSQQNVDMAESIRQVATAVKSCSDNHESKGKTLADQFTAFQVLMAQTTPTRAEMDTRIQEASAAKMELLQMISDDVKFLKGRIPK